MERQPGRPRRQSRPKVSGPAVGACSRHVRMNEINMARASREKQWLMRPRVTAGPIICILWEGVWLLVQVRWGPLRVWRREVM